MSSTKRKDALARSVPMLKYTDFFKKKLGDEEKIKGFFEVDKTEDSENYKNFPTYSYSMNLRTIEFNPLFL